MKVVRSMTGYGRARSVIDGRSITVEIKSINHRYLDCTMKTPRGCGFVEEPVRELVQQSITRGKVEVYVGMEDVGSGDVSVEVNTQLAGAYVGAVRRIAKEHDLNGEVSALVVARMPDVLTIIKDNLDVEAINLAVADVTRSALEELNAMRVREGEHLAADIVLRAGALAGYVAKLEEASPRSVASYAERLETRMKEILENREFDQTRLMTEVALFADRVSVTEELVRLKSHLSQLVSMLDLNEATGRKIDFLLQEINREINTVGSKSSDIEATKIVVDMKAEVEKIREQIQNLE